MYRGYEISQGPSYTTDSKWQFVHKDYDGPEDNRIGLCASVDECKSEIDCQIEDILFHALKATVGHLRNVQIDLETGRTRTAAIHTIKGGIRRAEYALSAAQAQSAGPKDIAPEQPR